MKQIFRFEKEIMQLKYTFVALGLVLCFSLTAQQQTPYSLYRDAAVLLNPASVTSTYFRNDYYNVRLGATYRQQWSGQEDAPHTEAVHFDYFPDYKPYSFSGNISNQQAGAIAETSVYATFRYQLKIDRSNIVRLGLSGGMQQTRIAANKIRFGQAGDIIHNGENLTSISPDFSFGATYYYKNRLWAGISVPQLPGFRNTFETSGNDLRLQDKQHFYATSGILFYTNQYETSFFEISTWLKYIPGSPFSTVLNFRYQHDELFWLGLGGDTSAIAHLEAGVILGSYKDRQLHLGAAYDYSFQPDVLLLGNTFELSLNWIWGGN